MDNEQSATIVNVEQQKPCIRAWSSRRQTSISMLATVVCVLTISLTVVIEVSLLMNWQKLGTAKDNKTSYDSSQETNKTLCSYLKSFPLSSDKKVSVCTYHGAVRIDIRRFLNDSATIQGIWLKEAEWSTLVKLLPYIQVSVTIAEQF